MKIEKLSLRSFRGVQQMDLELDPKLNVFIGVNGAGKTAILEAVAILLSWLVNRINRSGASGRPIKETDIQNKMPASTLSIECRRREDVIKWTQVKTRKGHFSRAGSSNYNEINDFAEKMQMMIAANQEAVEVPLMVYYPVNRSVLDIPLRIRHKHEFNVLAAFEESLTSGANFRHFFEWFREREDIENENRKNENVIPELKDRKVQVPDPQLEAVREAIAELMPEFSNLTVRRQPLRMEVDKNGKKFIVNQLSDGEKCLMAMVGDLARRLAIANPGKDNPLSGEGVVLIDEIDLHMHPAWQQMIIPRLTDVFQNCQFLVSTHSPSVVSHVHPKNLFLLNDYQNGIEVTRPHESYGKSVGRVMEDIMGLKTTRPEDVAMRLQKIYEKIDRGKYDDAKKHIAELKAEIGEDPDLIKARVLIQRKEVLGK